MLVLIVLLACGVEARAWGNLGHKVICEITYRLVKPETRQRIDALIRLDGEFASFRDSCVYPDRPRIRAPEQLINVPRDATGLQSDQCPLAAACVLTAIVEDSRR